MQINSKLGLRIFLANIPGDQIFKIFNYKKKLQSKKCVLFQNYKIKFFILKLAMTSTHSTIDHPESNVSLNCFLKYNFLKNRLTERFIVNDYCLIICQKLNLNLHYSYF